MSDKYGATVYGYGRKWDWGQALCVEGYGLNPNDWPDAPSNEDVLRAQEWEKGDLPEWIVTEVEL